MTTPRKGTTFTHKLFLHPDDRHLPVKQARKAEMRITMVTRIRIYYNYATTPDAKGRWYMPREYWQEVYGS